METEISKNGKKFIHLRTSVEEKKYQNNMRKAQRKTLGIYGIDWIKVHGGIYISERLKENINNP